MIIWNIVWERARHLFDIPTDDAGIPWRSRDMIRVARIREDTLVEDLAHGKEAGQSGRRASRKWQLIRKLIERGVSTSCE
jgi:hypothetical protein